MPDLFERACERAALAEALDRACAGRGSVVVVEGAAGVGKSIVLSVPLNSEPMYSVIVPLPRLAGCGPWRLLFGVVPLPLVT